MIDDNTIARANEVNALELAKELGYDVKNNKMLCPFHEEKTPSCSYNPKTNTFHCFGCSKEIDATDLMQKTTGASFQQAINQLLGAEQYQRPTVSFRTSVRATNASGEGCADIYEFFLDKLPFPEEEHHLVKERCLSLAVLKENGIKDLPDKKEDRYFYLNFLEKAFPMERLLASGLVSISKNNHPYFSFFDCCGIVPFFRDGKIFYLQGFGMPKNRAEGKRKNAFLTGIAKPAFYIPKLAPTGTIYLAEGVISSLYFKTKGNDSIALLSSSSVPDGCIKELMPYKSQTFVLVPDIDLAGKEAFERLKSCLFKNGFSYNPEMVSAKQIGREFGLSEEQLKGVKDINDLRHLIK